MNPCLMLAFLVTAALSASTMLYLRVGDWTSKAGSDAVLQVLFGEGRQVMANHMFVQADVYFHSGYYPSVFDQQYVPTNSQHMTEAGDHRAHNPPTHEEEPAAEGHSHAHESDSEKAESEHEKAMAFLQTPLDWIERFGRKFQVTSHTHLSAGKEREMLPWLRLSAELDPHRIDTYTVAAYWLRTVLKREKEAEQFLREGLRANPDSYEILLELARLYDENCHDTVRARNLYEAALRRWERSEAGKEKPDLFALDQILVRLARLEEQAGNLDKAIGWLELTLQKDASPNPDAIRDQIAALKKQRNGSPQ